MDERLLSLPLDIQVALATGYAAYLLAYIGIRSHHTSVDTIFRAIAFASIAAISLYYLPSTLGILRFVIGIVLTLFLAVFWRVIGSFLCHYLLREFDISWADDSPSAWFKSTQQNSKHLISQISVMLVDGTWLICEDASQFVSSPFGPCVLGLKGDIAMYASLEITPEGNEESQSNVRHDALGDRLTYIPAEQIKRISIRYQKRNNNTRFLPFMRARWRRWRRSR